MIPKRGCMNNHESLKPDIHKVLKKYDSKKDIIPALQDIQENFGFVSEENAESLAKKINSPLVDISGVVTFYNMFRLKPVGKYHIAICRGTACHVQNSEELLKYVEKKLKIKTGEITQDGRFSLEAVNCIGACAKAPAMMIHDKVYGQLTEKKIDAILDSMK
ncbi:TPA: NADH-quinone oxidoreductase subunit NuoE [Candidatus Woesearchaeota archaeon]|nr:NADH-quinone oxidoreductase subunit NuoE [Candidatus Woesearchaeota archaeon]